MAKLKKKTKKKRSYPSVFPVFYPATMGTPYGYRPGSANDSGGPSSDVSMPAAPAAGESISAKRKVIAEMRKSMGLVEYFNDAPGVATGGFSVPNFGGASMHSSGGPSLSGPGFQNDDEGKGGRYDFKKSPGLGFRTEMAWRIWEKALEIMSREKNLPNHSILLRAMSKAGIHRGQLDPAEFRLLEMGVDWYLSDSGSLGAKRGGPH